ncbi:MAG TPA: bifunctional diaminohydroxyphosphoribosylaminopyrimidine deaminase/5-amino-6-(5-phosphoribosylamino)uracil reductase RibD, partial [Planctomycetaceae bacterium]
MNPVTFASREEVMRRAIEIARRGAGLVEPNPLVGAVIVDEGLRLLGEGWHEKFGGPHAEIMAIANAPGAVRGATLYVTLEPCCHFGKTPPCVDAVLAAGLRRVVVAMSDPFPAVAGQGLRKLREANIEVEVGLLEVDAKRLTAPFRKLVEQGRPYVHAKWAMTLDGRLASRTGASKWISNETSRAVVHQLRGRMDAVVIGIGTALADDPLLTARPAGPRVATRVVLDSHARLPGEAQLVNTIGQAPLLIVVGPAAPGERIAALRGRGAEVLQLAAGPTGSHNNRPAVAALLAELGRRRMTNVLVEGGGEILGAFFDAQFIDEVHVFIAPKLLG